MTKDDIKKLCLESYLKGQEDMLELLIEATKKAKSTGQNYVSTDEMLLVYGYWSKKVKENYE